MHKAETAAVIMRDTDKRFVVLSWVIFFEKAKQKSKFHNETSGSNSLLKYTP
jgi:hypothetical protein